MLFPHLGVDLRAAVSPRAMNRQITAHRKISAASDL